MTSLRHFLLLSLFLLASAPLSAQAPEESEDIMLQGFYWNSQTVTSWTQLTDMASEIGTWFTCIWLPPSASPEGGGEVGGTNVGYHPREWTNQTSNWGTAEDLLTLISTLHDEGVKVIADIVINHRAGDTDWGNFTLDDFGSYGCYQLTAEHICCDDEMNTDTSAGDWYGLATGAADTGEGWDGARDLDHTSTYVQADCMAYLQWLKGEYGYDGWRYDYVKGYSGEYVGLYNDASDPYISVGECWDSSYDVVAAWIEATGRKSMAFDFPAKYAAFNNGLAAGSYANMSWIEDNTTWRPAGMIHHANYNRYAVTFVDNHDSYVDSSNKYTGNVPQAYAFLLSAPGIPCIFYPHWTSYKALLKQMITARKVAGIHSQSDVEVTQRSTYYECLAQGHNGNLICRIGTSAPSDVPDGYFLACSQGTYWKYYLSESLQEAYSSVAGVLAEEETETEGIYTLSGAKVSDTATPGIYILKQGSDSKKILVR